MDTFTASNGIVVKHYSDNRIEINCSGSAASKHDLSVSEGDALREFFRAEEDERLGRWRWPENPDVVVYRDGGLSRRSVTIVFEKTGRVVIGLSEKFLAATSDDGYESRKAARAYFDAHPEPKPWHDAKPGEVWLLTIDGEEAAFYPSKSLDRAFTPVAPNTGTTAVPMDWPEIESGRRIYPEEGDR